MCNAVLLHVVVAQYCGLSSCLNVLKALHIQRNDQRFTISPNSLKGSYLNSYKRWIHYFIFFCLRFFFTAVAFPLMATVSQWEDIDMLPTAAKYVH